MDPPPLSEAHSTGGRECSKPEVKHEQVRIESDCAASEAVAAQADSRRAFLGKLARKAAYVAPLVLLFKPRQVLAGSGDSLITPG